MEPVTLPEALRLTLPPIVQAYLAALEAQVAAQQAELDTLRARIAALEARTRQHSGTSSRPPSSDPPDAPPRPRRSPSGRRRGGQPGHAGQHRALLPERDIDHRIEHRPQQCGHCQAPLPPDLPDAAAPRRQQVWDLPARVQPVVTEHRYHTVCCPQCHTPVTAARPADVPAGAFGPQVIALVGLLHGRYRLSARETSALLADLFGVAVGVGSVPALCRQVSAALLTASAQVQAAVAAGAQANVDETGWKQAGQRRWLWVAVGVAGTLFLVATSRSATALATLLGRAFTGIVGSDRFSAYRRLPPARRQLCWAHLKRNLVAFAEWNGAIGAWGQEAVALVDRLFAAWHQYRAGTLDRAGLQAALAPVQAEVHALLDRGLTLRSVTVPALCRELLTLWPALWTFVTVEGIEPTNNVAERALRPAVLWRKGCFGAASAEGNVFVARLLTVAATCRQQQRHLLTYLTEAVRAHQAGLPAPSLIPTP